MDIKKGKLNVCVSIIFRIITMLMAIVVKKALIDTCGNEVNGLNALCISIIGVLSVAELGVGHAITFCMYKPIVEGKHEIVSALYQLFKKLYCLIGTVVFAGGLAIIPFLQYFVKDYNTLDVNIYLAFFLILVSATGTYFFSAKISLVNAYKNNYITTAITQSGLILQYVLQIAVLIITKSFTAYLLCRIVAMIAQWLVSEMVVRKKHSTIIQTCFKLDDATKSTVKKSIKAMFIHKIGSVLVNTVDNVVISVFVGVVALGEYSNYIFILSSMTGVIALLFSSLTSVVGHLCAESKKEIVREYFESFHLLNFVVGAVFFLGYFAVIDSLVSILFSAELIISKNVSIVIALNGFVQFMRQSALMFRDATGTFYQDRWKPLFEGITNIVLSIFLVNVIGLEGVILATVMTTLFICHIVEPYVLYKNVFCVSPKGFYLRNFSMIFAFVIMLVLLSECLQKTGSIYSQLFINGFVSLGFSLCLCICAILFNAQATKRLLKTLKKG